MKREITILFIWAAVVIGAITVMLWMFWGWIGAVTYLVFAALCLTPSVITAFRILKRERSNDEKI